MTNAKGAIEFLSLAFGRTGFGAGDPRGTLNRAEADHLLRPSQGRGHANRTMALVSEFSRDRPVSVMTAGPHLFDGFRRDIEIVRCPT